MKLPIVAYGDPVLKKVADNIDQDYKELKSLIDNMFETMYAASGVGLAAPQVGLPIRLFVVDASPFAEDEEGLKDFKKVFINPVIDEETGEKWDFNEGCLSIPDIRENVSRHRDLKISYYDESFELKKEAFTGLAARVIQHEYDHIQGKLFTDRINPLRKTMLRGKLDAISKGAVKVDYKMKFPLQRKKR
ncbi:peptide deformylase [Pedobacter arcticus]|uniref:peptide deformylase n=1 Tax=Pedobacter arcticus TaxID=752140 RepID=UPI0002F36FEF|nr:peptide deformylase [Pedobacter arcticus]